MSVSGSGLLDGADSALVRAECDVPGCYVKKVCISADGGRDFAILGAKPQDDEDVDIRFERALSLIAGDDGTAGGRMVKITAESDGQPSQTLLHGRIMDVNVVAQGRMEEIEYTVLGLDNELRSERLFGMWVWDSEDVAVHLRGLQLVFNPEGKPNKDVDELADDLGNQRLVFNIDSAQGSEYVEKWSGQALARYVATAERKGEVNDEPRVFETSKQVASELADFTLLDVNLEGENIWDGLVRVAHLCSHSVVMVYGEDRSDADLRFFTRNLDDAESPQEFEFPAVGALEITDRGRVIASIDAQVDFSGIVNQVDAVAPPGIYEQTFEMLRGWKQEDEDAAFGSGTFAQKIAQFLKETNPETSSDWERFQNVGRRWILDETGRDDTAPENTDPWDFSDLFSPSKWAVRHRPFLKKRATKDDAGQRLPVRVLVTQNSSSGLPTSIEVGATVKLLEDRAGIYFSARPQVDVHYGLDAALATDILPEKIEVDAAVEGDQSEPYGVFGSRSGDLRVPTFSIIRADEAMRVDNVTGDLDGIDGRLQELCDAAAEELGQRRDVGTYVCPYITNLYSVGDVVTNISGRGMEIRGIIMKITWDFMMQETQFALSSDGVETDTHSRGGTTMEGAAVDASTDVDLFALHIPLGELQTREDVFRFLHSSEGRSLIERSKR